MTSLTFLHDVAIDNFRADGFCACVLIGDGDGFSEPGIKAQGSGSGLGSRKGCRQATHQESRF